MVLCVGQLFELGDGVVVLEVVLWVVLLVDFVDRAVYYLCDGLDCVELREREVRD